MLSGQEIGCGIQKEMRKGVNVIKEINKIFVELYRIVFQCVQFYIIFYVNIIIDIFRLFRIYCVEGFKIFLVVTCVWVIRLYVWLLVKDIGLVLFVFNELYFSRIIF